MKAIILLVGIVLITVGVRGTHVELFELIKGDLVGRGSFLPWITSLFFIYALSFIPGFRPVARGFMILVLLVLFLKRGTGFFDRLNQQLGI